MPRSRDFMYQFIEQDAAKHGIEVRVRQDAGLYPRAYFLTREDLNLYKIVGNWPEGYSGMSFFVNPIMVNSNEWFVING